MRMFWLIIVSLAFSGMALSAEDVDKAESPVSARAETDAEKLARIKRNSARAHNARRAAVPRVNAKNAGGLSADKLNALLANAAVRNRRLGSNSAYLNRQVAASGVMRAGNPAGAGLASRQSPSAVRPASPLAPGRRLSGNGGNIVNFRNAAGVKGFGSPNPERFAAARRNAVSAARASGAVPAPATASGTCNAEIQKAVEAALAKRDAQSLGAKAARLGSKTIGVAKKFALALLMD